MMQSALAWVRDREPRMLLGLLAVVLSFWGFAAIADYALEGEARGIDEAILLAMRSPGDASDPLGPLWVEELARDVTALGSMFFVVLVTLASGAFLVLAHKARLALYLVLAVGTGATVSQLLKAAFGRPRPELVAHGQAVFTSSFPSGHSMLATITFLTVAAVLASAQPDRRLKAYLLTLAVLLSLAVGVTRIYLGVHWPTDVLAGWTAGSGWALLCWLLARRLRRSGGVE
jgi:undecaprenyl-diphosphatase